MATLKVILHPTNKTDEGKRNIVLRVTIQRIKYYCDLETGIKLYPTQLDNGQITHTAGIKNYQQVNHYITQRLADAHEILWQFKIKRLAVTIEAFRKQFYKISTGNLVFPYIDKLQKEAKENGKISKRNHLSTLKSSLLKFCGTTRLTFPDINTAFVKRFEGYLTKEGKKGNSKATYLSTLSGIYNTAIEDQLADDDQSPFKSAINKKGYNPKSLTTDTLKLALSQNDLQKIIEFETLPLSPVHDAKMFFLLSFYTRGANFADMALWKKENIRNNKLSYSRSKNKKKRLAIIDIIPQIREILNYFATHPHTKDGYLLPILSKKYQTDSQIKPRVNKILSYVNPNLKKIGSECNLQLKLTSNVARHTWATLAYKSGEPVAMISEALMHATIKQTYTYLKSFENEELDNMNERLIKSMKK